MNPEVPKPDSGASQVTRCEHVGPRCGQEETTDLSGPVLVLP